MKVRLPAEVSECKARLNDRASKSRNEGGNKPSKTSRAEEGFLLGTHRGVAQLAECATRVREVAGSNPATPTNFDFTRRGFNP